MLISPKKSHKRFFLGLINVPLLLQSNHISKQKMVNLFQGKTDNNRTKIRRQKKLPQFSVNLADEDNR